jgi:aspartyl-tRNA(Asn)/glutamyl-tRNA(Gln) amidotransferase subunit C
MALSDADLDHVADLARLELAADERESLRGDLERLLAYVALLGEADVAGVEPMLRPAALVDVLRDDVAVAASGSGMLEALAPAWHQGRVRVPRTVDQDA